MKKKGWTYRILTELSIPSHDEGRQAKPEAVQLQEDSVLFIQQDSNGLVKVGHSTERANAFVWNLYKLEGSVDFFQVEMCPVTGNMSRKPDFYMSGPGFISAISGSLPGHDVSPPPPITVHLNQHHGENVKHTAGPSDCELF